METGGCGCFGLRVLVIQVLPLGVCVRVLGFVIYVSKMHDVGKGVYAEILPKKRAVA